MARVPVLLQLSATECGAACLAMILNYYRCKVKVAEIREQCGVGRDGLTVRTIVKVARSYGLRTRAVSVLEDSFHLVSLPCIIHWEFSHFMVVEHWSPSKIEVIDPSCGHKVLTKEEFEAGFTGIAVMLEPGVQFKKREATRNVSLRSYLFSAFRAPIALIQILFASLILQAFGLVLPWLTELLVDQIIPLQMHDLLLWIGIGIVIIIVAQFIVNLLRSLLLVYLQTRIDSRMMLTFFEHVLTLPYSFFQQRSNGDLLMRLNSNAFIRDTLTGQFLAVLLDGSFVFIYLLILLWRAPLFGLFTFIIALLQVGLLWATNRKLRQLTQRELAAQGKAQGEAAEILSGIETLKTMGAEYRAFEHWSNLFFEQLNAFILRGNFSARVDSFLLLLRTFAPLFLLWFMTFQVLQGIYSLGTMLALNALATAFFAPLSSLVTSGQQLQLLQSHLARIGDVVSAKSEQDLYSVQSPPRLSGKIEVKDVVFRYHLDAPLVLDHVSLCIEAGQKVALVGRTGSGKSTLGKLLLGIYQPVQGEIYYDGLPLRSLKYSEVRSQFGVVLQDAFVFSGSIRHNIAFNVPDMPLEKISEFARIAAIHEDIASMPMGYETPVAEGGSALSGGQRQRLALARALASTPPILLLDEATSHLDVVTEQLIEKNVDVLRCTRIVIAHRLNTIRNADQIVVLEHGKIVEVGKHEELLQSDGSYAKLMQGQLEDGEYLKA